MLKKADNDGLYKKADDVMLKKAYNDGLHKNYTAKYEDNKDTFQKNLAYFIPGHGSPKQSLRIPQCHKLFICPPSCGRRNAIRAFKNGEKNEISFLFVTQGDLISGNYENIIGDGVQDILELLPTQPKAFILYFNCIDDFLGTDEQALLRGLADRFSDLKFTLCHINPIADQAGTPQGMLMYDRLYSFIQEKTEDAPAINLIGNFVAIDPNSEFFRVLSAFGISKVNQIFQLNTFEEYESMANSRLNLVLMVMGTLAARKLYERLGTPWLYQPPSYDILTIQQAYDELALALNRNPLDFAGEIQQLKTKIAETLNHIKDTPIVVDTIATMNPFALAHTLVDYGFNVEAIFASHAKKTDQKDLEYLQTYYGHIKIINTLNYQEVLKCKLSKNCIAIGFDGAYSIRAKHFVDIRHDEGFYGFYGVWQLMTLIATAYDEEVVWD